MPSSKFWKSENGRTEWTIVMKLCIYIDIDKMYPKRLSNVIWIQILKNSEAGPISWNFLNILIKLCIDIAIDVS